MFFENLIPIYGAITWRWGQTKTFQKGFFTTGLQTSIGPLKVHEIGCSRQMRINFSISQAQKSVDIDMRTDANPYLNRNYFTLGKKRLDKKQTPWIQISTIQFFIRAALKTVVTSIKARASLRLKVARFVPGREGKSNLSFLFNTYGLPVLRILLSACDEMNWMQLGYLLGLRLVIPIVEIKCYNINVSGICEVPYSVTSL